MTPEQAEIRALNDRIVRFQASIDTAKAQNVAMQAICDQWLAELGELVEAAHERWIQEIHGE